MSKIKLDLLKRLVSELESSISKSDLLASSTEKIEYVVELSKAGGLAAAIMGESALLVGDIQYLTQGAPAPTAGSKAELLEKILGTKGTGKIN